MGVPSLAPLGPLTERIVAQLPLHRGGGVSGPGLSMSAGTSAERSRLTFTTFLRAALWLTEELYLTSLFG